MKERLSYNDVNIRPQYSEISSRSNVDISTEICGHELNIPVIAAPMESVVGSSMWTTLQEQGSLGIIPRFNNRGEIISRATEFSLSVKSKPPVIPAIGVDNEPPIFDSTIDTVLIDVAHGHHEKVKLTIKYLKENSDLNIIAGNVATPEAALDLIKWGADALRIGVGSGSVCTTRTKTGVGVPMVSCIQEINEAIHAKEIYYSDGSTEEIPEDLQFKMVPIIADGGMKTPGDIAKALAAGADAVMLGSMFAGTDEAPGEIIEVDGDKYKKYYGSASFEQKGEQNYVEGVSSLVPYKGSVVDILKDIKDGLQSSFSYVNASNLEEFHNNAELIKVSNHGWKEGTAHIK